MAEVIYGYTRAQALADGGLLDVTPMAKECGFRHPVAVTEGLWATVVATNQADAQDGQSTEGRLWDVLNVLRYAIMRYSGEEEPLLFTLSVWRSGHPADHTLKALCHGGDKGEPVMTLMLPHED